MKVFKWVVIVMFLFASVASARVAMSKNTSSIKGTITKIDLNKGFIQVNEVKVLVKKRSPVIKLIRSFKIGDYVIAYFKSEGNTKLLLAISKLPKEECGGPK